MQIAFYHQHAALQLLRENAGRMQDHGTRTAARFAGQEGDQIVMNSAAHFVNSFADRPLQLVNSEWPRYQRSEIRIRATVQPLLEISRDQTYQGNVRGVLMNRCCQWYIAVEVAHFHQQHIWRGGVQCPLDGITNVGELDDRPNSELIGFTR